MTAAREKVSMLSAVKRLGEAVVAGVFSNDFDSKIAEARAKVETAKRELEQVRLERADAVRQAEVNFDDTATDEKAEALIVAREKQKLFVGRAESAVRTSETLLTSLELQRNESELAELEKLNESGTLLRQVEEICRTHSVTLIEAAMTIGGELQVLEASARKRAARIRELRQAVGRPVPMHPSGLDMSDVPPIQQAKTKILLETINATQGGRELALWIREI